MPGDGTNGTGQLPSELAVGVSTGFWNLPLGNCPGAWAVSAVDIRCNFGNYQGFMHDYSSYCHKLTGDDHISIISRSRGYRDYNPGHGVGRVGRPSGR